MSQLHPFASASASCRAAWDPQLAPYGGGLRGLMHACVDVRERAQGLVRRRPVQLRVSSRNLVCPPVQMKCVLSACKRTATARNSGKEVWWR